MHIFLVSFLFVTAHASSFEGCEFDARLLRKDKKEAAIELTKALKANGQSGESSPGRCEKFLGKVTLPVSALPGVEKKNTGDNLKIQRTDWTGMTEHGPTGGTSWTIVDK